MNRRHFFKLASGGVLLAGMAPTASHAAAQNRPPIPGALGMLYDSTLCVGCQACVTKCQEINHPEPMERGDTYANGDPIWSNNDKLSPYTN
nr:hydrogenase 2 protein HybA [Proteus mirabilis]